MKPLQVAISIGLFLTSFTSFAQLRQPETQLNQAECKYLADDGSEVEVRIIPSPGTGAPGTSYIEIIMDKKGTRFADAGRSLKAEEDAMKFTFKSERNTIVISKINFANEEEMGTPPPNQYGIPSAWGKYMTPGKFIMNPDRKPAPVIQPLKRDTNAMPIPTVDEGDHDLWCRGSLI